MKTDRLKSKRKRIKSDFYPTPRGLIEGFFSVPYVKALLEKTPEGHIIDPGCGDGRWGESVPVRWNSKLVGIDVEEHSKNIHFDEWTTGDYLEKRVLFDEQARLVVGNPPFSQAEEFIERSYVYLKTGGMCIFLLRLGFLASQKRFEFFQNYPLYHLFVSSRRPGFFSTGRIKNGFPRISTDNFDYGIFVWKKEHRGSFIGSHFTWEYTDKDHKTMPVMDKDGNLI